MPALHPFSPHFLDFSECPDTDCDCDDSDPRIHSSATDVAYDGIDQNCDGADRADVDADAHLSKAVGGDDCNDFEQYTFPGAPEVRDGVDNDCDGQIDDHIDPILDWDDDGYPGGSAADCSILACDCNDSRPDIHPSARELCDGIDNNCDGKKDSSSCAAAITFHLDTTYGGDGDNPLAAVPRGSHVYLVGNFTAWNPNHAGFEMSDPEGDGVWTLTLPVPLMGYAYDETMVGTPTQFNAGDAIEFKFALTSSGPCDPTASYYDYACWSEGQKDFLTHIEAEAAGLTCRGDDVHGGRWEITPRNYSMVVPSTPTTVTLVLDAWFGTALEYGYPDCENRY